MTLCLCSILWKFYLGYILKRFQCVFTYFILLQVNFLKTVQKMLRRIRGFRKKKFEISWRKVASLLVVFRFHRLCRTNFLNFGTKSILRTFKYPFFLKKLRLLLYKLERFQKGFLKIITLKHFKLYRGVIL